jgi:hypothetical protein
MKRKRILFVIATVVCSVQYAAVATDICGRTDFLGINGNEYMAQNNIWGATTAQCISVNGTSFTVTRSEHNQSTSGSPAAYPSLFKGCHWRECTSNSGMPIQVSQIQNATINWSNSLGASGAWNCTSEAWFKRDSNPGDPDGAELMIWINHSGSVQPGGSQIGTATIAGQSWQVWFNQIGWNFITYRTNSPTSSVNLDYRPFIDDAISRGYIQSSWYMMDIEAGFEIWQWGTGLACTNFTAAINSGSVTTPNPTAAPNITPDPTNPPTGLMGDVNNDGTINIVDALLVAQYYVGLIQTLVMPQNADVNRDGTVNIVDALQIAQCYVGLRNCKF